MQKECDSNRAPFYYHDGLSEGTARELTYHTELVHTQARVVHPTTKMK